MLCSTGWHKIQSIARMRAHRGLWNSKLRRQYISIEYFFYPFFLILEWHSNWNYPPLECLWFCQLPVSPSCWNFSTSLSKPPLFLTLIIYLLIEKILICQDSHLYLPSVLQTTFLLYKILNRSAVKNIHQWFWTSWWDWRQEQATNID